MELSLGAVDQWQRRHAVVAFPVAVVRKFSDDNAGALAGLLAYYAFVATFPMLLVLVTILEFVLSGDPELQRRLLDSALGDFPVIGDQLSTSIDSIDGSGWTVALGLLVALFGARGVAVTFQRVCATVWTIPYVERPPIQYAALRTASLLLLIAVGALSGAAVLTFVASVDLGVLSQAASLLLSLALAVALFLGVFRIATPRQVATRDLVRGAIVSAVTWHVLLTVGSVLIAQQLRNASALYGVFGVVLGLLAWFVLQATATLYAMEYDVVRARRLWPRGLQPPLTAADEKALASYARGERRDESQEIKISFD